MSIAPFSARLNASLKLIDPLIIAADAALASARRAGVRARRQARGHTLRPGQGTPLWNELARAVHAHAQRFGDKARLARVLGVPRQRVDDDLVARRRQPDAEHTLRLLHWLAARIRGATPG